MSQSLLVCLNVLAAYSVAFLLKELNGPFDVILLIRSYLFQSKFGVFFYKLFDCYYCLTFHTSYIISFILGLPMLLTFVIAFVSSICSLFLNSLHR